MEKYGQTAHYSFWYDAYDCNDMVDNVRTALKENDIPEFKDKDVEVILIVDNCLFNQVQLKITDKKSE